MCNIFSSFIGTICDKRNNAFRCSWGDKSKIFGRDVKEDFCGEYYLEKCGPKPEKFPKPKLVPKNSLQTPSFLDKTVFTMVY